MARASMVPSANIVAVYSWELHVSRNPSSRVLTSARPSSGSATRISSVDGAPSSRRSGAPLAARWSIEPHRSRCHVGIRERYRPCLGTNVLDSDAERIDIALRFADSDGLEGVPADSCTGPGVWVAVELGVADAVGESTEPPATQPDVASDPASSARYRHRCMCPPSNARWKKARPG